MIVIRDTELCNFIDFLVVDVLTERFANVEHVRGRETRDNLDMTTMIEKG